MTVSVHRAEHRAVTTHPGVTTRHAFSAGAHYDPGNTGLGALVLHDEHLLAPGAGFDLHQHRDLEVVTWVLSGELHHEDSSGARAVVRPGTVQRLSAGCGVTHAERNGGSGDLRFVQAWVLPDETGAGPAYDLAEVGACHGLVTVASGTRGTGAPVALGRADAALHVLRMAAGDDQDLPDAPRLHVHVTAGEVQLQGIRLRPGDAVRLSRETGVSVTASSAAELLVWQLGS